MAETTSGTFELPAELSDRIERLTGERPRTLRDALELGAELSNGEAEPITLDRLRSADPTRHAAALDGEPQYFHCVLDAILVPFVTDHDRVQIWSGSPQDGTVVVVDVTPDRLVVEPDGAVFSFGMGPLRTDDEPEPTDELLHSVGCRYINSFPSHEAYAAWAEATDGVTVELTPAEIHRVAGAVADR